MAGEGAATGAGSVAVAVGAMAAARPIRALGWFAAIGVLAVGLLRIEVDEERIRYFRESEPIRRADRAINAWFDGTTHVDVVIETSAPEALFRPDHLRRIDAIQAYVETPPKPPPRSRGTANASGRSARHARDRAGGALGAGHVWRDGSHRDVGRAPGAPRHGAPFNTAGGRRAHRARPLEGFPAGPVSA